MSATLNVPGHLTKILRNYCLYFRFRPTPAIPDYQRNAAAIAFEVQDDDFSVITYADGHTDPQHGATGPPVLYSASITGVRSC